MSENGTYFTLVCLRQFEEEIELDNGIHSLSLSHDRRLLSLRDYRDTVFCYACDNSRPSFLLRPPILEHVDQSLWLHMPAEKSVLLDHNALSEFPGAPCLVALQQETMILTLCRFFHIESSDVRVVDDEVKLEDVRSLTDKALIEWGSVSRPEALPSNTVWRHSVPLADVVALIPECRHFVSNDGHGGRRQLTVPVRMCAAKQDLLAMFVNDMVAILLKISWTGVRVSHCFFLKNPALEPMQFCDVTACSDWIFAVTAPPAVLLIWYITGVAFHAIPLADHVYDVNFVSLVVSLDLLGVALTDDKHRVWILSLDRYFDGAPRVDWELLKERQRCADGVPVDSQMTKEYQELSVYPDAFGLTDELPVGQMQNSKTSLMDCLVEGVPTYGILVPTGTFGSDQISGRERPDEENDHAEGRCVPYAWHERIYQAQEWIDLDRRWTVDRVKPANLQGSASPTQSFPPVSGNRGLLSGFSVPAQHRLGDDDFHYSLYEALQKHARRQSESRLPPWLMRVKMPRTARRINPPVLGRLGGDREESADSDSGSELADVSEEEDDYQHHVVRHPSGGRSEGSAVGSDVDAAGRHAHLNLKSTGEYEVGGSSSTPRRRRHVSIGSLSLSITASHVFCEIWEEKLDSQPKSPWGLCVIPRPSFMQRRVIEPRTQVDHLTGGLMECVGNSDDSSSASQKLVSFRSRSRWRSLVTQNNIWYMLTEGTNLHSLLLDQSPVRIISNLLVFESRAKASRLCALNGWNAKQLPVLTLFLGLRFGELDEIRQSLCLLRPDQEMEACLMIMSFIHSGYSCANIKLPFVPALSLSPVAVRSKSNEEVAEGQLPSDRSFVSRLLEIAMQFITRLIQTRVVQIRECEGACRALTYLQPDHAATETEQDAAMVHELSQLTLDMQSLRGLQQQLIMSFGDEKAYDSGIVIQCPPQETKDLGTASQVAVLPDTPKDKLAAVRTPENIEAVVRGALISGRVSSALNWFHELSEEGGAGVFEEFRVIAGRLAYQLTCNQQIDFLFVAMHMLRNVGENVNLFFKAVAFHTSKRLVRRRLLMHLRHMKRLSQEEQNLISLVNLLERLYTNPCYTTEFNRMTTCLVVGQYPQQAHSESTPPPYYTWPAGGRSMLLVGLRCDGAIGGHINVLGGSGEVFEQQTSVRDLASFQRMPLELYDPWGGFQNSMTQAMMEMTSDAHRAWNALSCGDVDDLDPQPTLGLSNFHKASNLESEQDTSIIAEMREVDGADCNAKDGVNVHSAARSTCRQCRLEALKEDDQLELQYSPDQEFMETLGVNMTHTMGYLHVTLSWMKALSWETRARIIMEKTHYWSSLVESLPWLQPEQPDAWRRCWLNFFVAHQDWRGLADWVRRMPLKLSDRVDSYGKTSVDLTYLEERGLPYCTSYVREILLQELGRRGLFCRSDVSSFPALLRRLAQCGCLFGEGYRPALTEDVGDDEAIPLEGALPLDRLLPRRSACPFHEFFIHFCIDNDLPTVMLLYLQNYELATTIEDLKALRLRHAQKPWASLLLVGRLGNAHLFAASLQHAAVLVASGSWKGGSNEITWHDADNVPFLSLNNLAMFSSISFLATLMFAPVGSVLEADPSSPWYVDPEVFQDVVSKYPTLAEVFSHKVNPSDVTSSPSNRLGTSLVESVAEACRRTEEHVAQGVPLAEKAVRPLDNIVTFKEDVSLFELLSDVAVFDVHTALKPLPIFKGDDSSPLVDGNLAALEEEEKFHDTLGEGYFLAQGRAMMAFHVMGINSELFDAEGELSVPLALGPVDTKRLHVVAKSVALHNLLNEGVVSSAVCLLELCSLETEMLRVDVQAAKRIYEHQVRASESGGEGSDRSRAAAVSVIELFLSFPDVEVLKGHEDGPSRAAEAAINSGSLLTALRMLEESTWALDPHPSAPTMSSVQSLAYDSPWHLVALFCRVHSLPRSLTLLHELARNNDWVMFLHESDLQQCPADTVLDVVDGYFMDSSLQSHLRILAHSISAQDQNFVPGRKLKSIERGQNANDRAREEENQTEETTAPQDDTSVDAIDFLECRQASAETGTDLLQRALSNRSARLAVVASAFDDVSCMQCMTVWLSVNAERSQIETGNFSPAEVSQANLAAQVASLCRNSQAFSLILRALKIFDPNNPLVDFVKFHRAFVQCRFQNCREHLRRFVERREQESQPDQPAKSYCLEVVPYVTSLSDEIVQHLLDAFPRSRLLLLSSLDQANFSAYYSHLFRSFRLIQQTGLNVDFRIPASELLQLLISKKMFAEAREWAKSSGIVGDTIVFEEVTGMIVEFRQGVWWHVLDERLRLWHKCYDAFLVQNYPALRAANFFLDITSKLEPDLFAREQLMLLCIAFELLGTEVDSTNDEAAVPQKLSAEHLNKIKLSMLLILTGTNKELAAELDFSPLDLSYHTLRSLVNRIPESVAALPLYHMDNGGGTPWGAVSVGDQVASALVADQRGPRSELLPYLDTAISSLINCDAIAWAKRLARGFDFESADLQLAEALEMVASGHQEEAKKALLAGHVALDPAWDDADVEKVLKSLSTQCSLRISLFCRRCMVFFAVSQTIGMDYRQVAQVDASELLDRLLSNPLVADISLCKSLLACYPKSLNKALLASILANRFIQSLGGEFWNEDKLVEYVSLLGSSQEMLGDAALSRIRNFQLEGSSATDAQLVDQNTLPYECEVEVLIMAYHAYVQACRERSIGDLLRLLRVRVEVYVERGRFALLLRLLFAIPEYHAMEYMFGHLVRRGQLDGLLTQGRAQGCTQRPALAVALIRYLHHHFPRNLELLVKVHLCFRLEGELAQLLDCKAKQLSLSIGRKWERICSEEGEEKLLMCLSLFLQCSRYYLKAKHYQKHLVANELAALICLQLKAVQIHLAASLQEQNALRHPHGDKSHGIEDDCSDSFLQGLGDANALDVVPAKAAVFGVSGTALGETSGDTGLFALQTSSGVGNDGNGCEDHDEPQQQQQNVGEAGAVAHNGHGLSLGPAGDPFVVINLESAEVEVFVEYHHDFITSFQVVNAYKHTHGEALHRTWPRALYRQVVLLGNSSYLQSFLLHLPLTKECLENTILLHINEPCPEEFPARSSRMKSFLREGVPNLETRYQLAKQLGPLFTDISMETASLVYMA